jgi:hypothetical protein
MFAEDAKLLTQDKQTFHGKPAVLRRLEKGGVQSLHVTSPSMQTSNPSTERGANGATVFLPSHGSRFSWLSHGLRLINEPGWLQGWKPW